MAKNGKSVEQLYTVGPRGEKARVSAGTKWPRPAAENTAADGSTGGNAATLAAVAALGATFTREQYVAACVARNHKGFVAYGLRNMWIVPVA